ncbi:MAG: TetR/AcrR family transcriptional regulator [Anaerolineaceae bacterium]|nr:TetR/AcrR family transcriptional regulator [Anaerolineaceae bacterium]
MARVLNEEQHAEKRNEILDVAQRLVYTRGYEQMSIQEIINELRISKGAFYHYFPSKQDLLEAMIARSLDQAMQVLAPLVDDPNIPALEKMNRYFVNAGQWKIKQKEYMLAIFRVWYADENAIMRQKLSAATIRRMAPIITRIVQQGINEGAFHTPFPEQSGEVVLSLLVSYSDVIASRMMDLGLGNLRPAPKDNLEFAERFHQFQVTIQTFTNAMERILGAPAGSIQLIDPATLEDWFDEPPAATPPIPAMTGEVGGKIQSIEF